MVGVSVALHLQRRGRDVALIDRRDPGEETSYGNAGLIQREAVIPYTFPREFGVVLSYAMNNRRDPCIICRRCHGSRLGFSSTGGTQSPNGSNDRCERLPR